MDVKLYIFFACLTLGLQNASAQIPGMVLTTDDPDKQCTTKYTTCSLKIDDKLIPQRGEKGKDGIPGRDGVPGVNGARGEQGLPGVQGPAGERGETGQAGSPGMPGNKGIKGDQGNPGETGPKGPPGVRGDMGSPGLNGEPGNKGDKGDRGVDGKMGPPGPEGKPGPVGPPGADGRHGVCPCFDTPNTSDEIERGDEFGTKAFPAEVPCKSAAGEISSGTYYLGPSGKDMEVFCNMKTLETCIRSSNRTREFTHDPTKGPYWLNTVSVHMQDLYTLSAEQLIWLRDRAESVRQTLKYNCKDSIPYAKHNMSSSVKLWAWNDVVIGPYPTNDSPVFYSVPRDTDHCEEGSSDWRSTIIELHSYNVYRLPIVDMWIGDVRHADQKMTIESVELCFG